MNNQWEECQDLVEQVFGERVETPLELVQIMICMSDMVLEAQGQRTSATKAEAAAMS